MQYRHAEESHLMIASQHLFVVEIDAKLLVQRADPPDSQPIVTQLSDAIKAGVAKLVATARQPQVAAVIDRGPQDHGRIAVRHREYDLDAVRVAVRHAVGHVEAGVNGSPGAHQAAIPPRVTNPAIAR